VNPNLATTSAFLKAMEDKDLSHAPLAEDVSYQSPLAGEPIRGRDRVCRFIAVYLPVISEVRVIRQIAEDDYVATVWQAETSFGPLSLVYVFRVENGQIAEIQAFYDPRGFLERMGTAGA
jgi:limonene-1,2-epoxide hydrolase